MKNKIRSENILEKKLLDKEAVIGVIGMGYIGLSLLEAFGKAGYKLLGYDLNKERVAMLKDHKSYLNFMPLTDLFTWMDQNRFTPSSNPSILKKADVLVISVPTSLDRYRSPDLTNLRNAFETVAGCLKKNQLIVLQSSTYPGTTEEELLPILAQSHLTVGKDIFLAHVPEVADIGNPKFSFTDVPRIVSGVTSHCLKMVKTLYQQIGCKVVETSSPKIAEAAKLLQNAHRLVEISFINEMKIMFDRMGIDVWEVIEAAASKPFGFTAFYPGPGIGGDCIPIAPFYLVWKAKVTEGPTTLLEQAGHINEMMPIFVFNKIVQGLNTHNKTINDAKILIIGVGYKKDVNDVRESPALKILSFLKKMKAKVFYNDPYVPVLNIPMNGQSFTLKSVDFAKHPLSEFDAIVIVTDHSCYNWEEIVDQGQLIIDTRNVTAKIKHSKKKVIKG